MAAVQDSELFASVLDGVADGVLVVDASGAIVYASERACAMFGYQRTDLIGRPAEVLVPEPARDVHERVRSGSRGTAHAREMGSGLPLEGRRSDGSVISLDIRLEPLRSDGMVVASIRQASPTPRDGELAELRRREEALRSVLDTVTQHLFAIGMLLSTIERHASDPVFADRLASSAELLDRTIELTRSAQHVTGPTRRG